MLSNLLGEYRKLPSILLEARVEVSRLLNATSEAHVPHFAAITDVGRELSHFETLTAYGVKIRIVCHVNCNP